MSTSRWQVMKFGGTSVATASNWRNIADRVRNGCADGSRVLVVHSALSGVSSLLARLSEAARPDRMSILAEIDAIHAGLATALGVARDETYGPWLDELQELVDEITSVEEPDADLQARVLALGELAATSIGADYLRSCGIQVSWLDARDVLSSLDEPDRSDRGRRLAARCDDAYDGDLAGALAALAPVVLTQGFIARDAGGRTVLLGRGGSDTSAAYFAAKLAAERLEIWTDVPGMFSANPKTVPGARMLRHLGYDEAQEIASAGGAVLHPRSVTPVRKAGIPLFIGSTVRPDLGGTTVGHPGVDPTPQLKAITCRRGLTLISMQSMDMWQRVGFLAQMFDRFRKHGVSVDLVATSESNVTASVDPGINAADEGTLTALAADLATLCRVELLGDCTAVSLVGRNISRVLHDIGPALAAFGGERMRLVSLAANDLNLSFVTDARGAGDLVRELHSLLVDHFADDAVFGPSWETLTASG